VQSEIEKAQPYNVPHPELPPALELLGTLDIIDKHKMLNVMAAVPHRASLEMTGQGVISDITMHRTGVEGKTEILSFTVDPPNRDLSYKCEAMIVICVAHSPGPSKSPFSELAGVLHTIIEEVEELWPPWRRSSVRSPTSRREARSRPRTSWSQPDSATRQRPVIR
jgi:hypothetical protein